MDSNSVNWPMAIGVSLAIHVLIVGGMFMTSESQDLEPDNMESPVAETPVKPALPEIPAKPAIPDSPKKPEAPAKPEVPAEPAKPQVPVEPAKPVKPESAILADYEEYTVKSGDNLTAIAKKFKTNFTELAALNQKSVKQLSALRIGQVIKVPKSTENR